MVIRQGLSAGDEVVVAGANLLRDGQKVQLPGARPDSQDDSQDSGQGGPEGHGRPDAQRKDGGA